MDETLRPRERLKVPAEYRLLFAKGRCYRSPHLRIHYLANGRGFSRLGLVVSRRVGNAVVRNRVKRLLREVFRRNKVRLQIPMDIAFVPQGGPKGHAEYIEAFTGFVEKCGGPVSVPGR